MKRRAGEMNKTIWAATFCSDYFRKTSYFARQSLLFLRHFLQPDICKSALILTISFLSILCGFQLYFECREFKELIAADWVSWVLPIRNDGRCNLFPKDIEGVLIYSAPDLLWTLSFCLIFSSIWKTSSRKYYWMLLPLILGLSSEIGQVLGWVPGTFDSVDLLAYLFGWGIAIWVDKLIFPKPIDK
jgi:hypothetical protein